MGLRRRDHHRQCSAEASRSPDRSGWLDRRVLRALRALISNPMPCVDNSGINPGTPPSIIQSGSQRFHEQVPSRLSRSEENTSELQSLMRISYAVFCLKKKTKKKQNR